MSHFDCLKCKKIGIQNAKEFPAFLLAFIRIYLCTVVVHTYTQQFIYIHNIYKREREAKGDMRDGSEDSKSR